MSRVGAFHWRGLAGTLAIAIAALKVSIVGVYLLEESVGARDASTLFLLSGNTLSGNTRFTIRPRLKLRLFFRPNTVVVDVPYHL